MKNIIYILVILVSFSCKEEAKNEALKVENITTKSEEGKVEKTNSKNEIEEEDNLPTNKFLGYYVGQFIADVDSGSYSYSDRNKINISIDKIKNDSVFGHTIVAGNNRPFKGTYSETNLEITGIEPGDDKYDGKFYISLDENGNKISGTWLSNNRNLNVNKRKFDLEKRVFRYDKEIPLFEEVDLMTLYNKELESDGYQEFLTEDVITYNPSSTLLKEEDVANMKKGDLEVIRNSIFARHGYSFKTKKMRYVFDAIEWYIPVSTDVRHELTNIEKQNIDLIKRFEKHAERYYDSFGR